MLERRQGGRGHHPFFPGAELLGKQRQHLLGGGEVAAYGKDGVIRLEIRRVVRQQVLPGDGRDGGGLAAPTVRVVFSEVFPEGFPEKLPGGFVVAAPDQLQLLVLGQAQLLLVENGRAQLFREDVEHLGQVLLKGGHRQPGFFPVDAAAYGGAAEFQLFVYGFGRVVFCPAVLKHADREVAQPYLEGRVLDSAQLYHGADVHHRQGVVLHEVDDQPVLQGEALSPGGLEVYARSGGQAGRYGEKGRGGCQHK